MRIDKVVPAKKQNDDYMNKVPLEKCMLNSL